MTPRLRIVALLLLFGVLAASSCDSDDRGSGDQREPAATDQPPSVPATAPRLRLRVSGNLQGYLMPCGCASGQLGGLARRAFRNNLDARSIDLLIEGGNLIKEAGELEFSKLMTALEVLALGKYKAIGLAATDLTIDKDELGSLLAAFVPVVASDLLLADGKPWTADGDVVAHAYREEKLEPVTVRIASLTMSLPEGPAGKAFKLLSPEEGWRRAMADVAEETYRIVMIHADTETIQKLRLRPKPDLIIGVNQDYVEPPPNAAATDGVPLVQVGIHGRVLLDVTIARGPNGPIVTEHRPVPLKGSTTAPDAMRDREAAAVILGHRQTVKEDGMLERLAGKLATPSGARYVGAKACAECHDEDTEKCAGHAHTHAWQTLIDAEKREKWPVTSYPECVSCHVVGYGYASGFVNPQKTPELLNVTCENCHGPGSIHVDAGGDKKMPLGKPPVSSCTECHNFEHSPKFDYTKFWKMIEHGK